MTVALKKEIYPYLNSSLLHLRSSWCRATESSTHMYLSTDLNDCSTTYVETESSLIFMNEIQGEIGRIESVVTRDHDFDLQFNCSYSRKKFLSLSFTPQGIVVPPGQGIIVSRCRKTLTISINSMRCQRWPISD